ncbi:MAG: peptide ABC transporter substrate-binding protein [Bacillota bacterium]|nr:peptide ABC transporter substrate-binding protein [Bacillota bacterium]
MKRAILILLILSLALGGCATLGIGATEYRTVYSGELTTMNYLVTGTTAEQAVAANTVDGLVEYDNFGVLKPSLATSWTRSADGLVWTFKLREGVKWVTWEAKEYGDVVAQDFVDAAKYILTKANASRTSNILCEVMQGAQDYWDGVTDDFTTVGVKATGKYTLEYTLKEEVPYFLTMLTYVCFLPAPAKFLSEVKDKFGTDHKTLVYNGAYILKNFEPQNIREYVKNTRYWDKDKVHITKLTYRYNKEASTLAPEMFIRGEISSTGIPTAVLDAWMKDAAKKDLVVPALTSYYTYFYAFNFDPKFDAQYEPDNWKIAVNNLSFRKSIFHALDRVAAMITAEPYEPSRRILNTVTPRNFVATGGTDYTMIGPLAAFTKADSFKKTLAAEFKTQALADLQGKAKFPVKIMMPYNTGSSDWTNRVQVVEQQLETLLGTDYIDVIPVPFPATGFLNATRRAGNYCIQECNWGPDYADPHTYTDPFTPGSNYNWPELAVGYTEENGNTKYVNLVNAARAETKDLKKRYEFYAAAEAHLIGEAFLIPYGVGGGGFMATKLDPFTAPYAPFGVSTLKFKYQAMLKKAMTAAEYKAAQTKWETDRAAALKAAGQ